MAIKAAINCRAIAIADAKTVPMPVASLIRDHFIEGVAQGRGDAD
jgi:hypothetical protein